MVNISPEELIKKVRRLQEILDNYFNQVGYIFQTVEEVENHWKSLGMQSYQNAVFSKKETVYNIGEVIRDYINCLQDAAVRYQNAQINQMEDLKKI